MPHWKVDAETRACWNSYPVRIVGLRMSLCHGKTTLLVRSMEGGFVTANCAECGNKDNLSEQGFFDLGLWVSCPRCTKRMKSGIIDQKNYGFSCQDCEIHLRLADLLPLWSDV